MSSAVNTVMTLLSVSISEIQHSIIVVQHGIGLAQFLVKFGISVFYLAGSNVGTRAVGLVASTTNLDLILQQDR